MPRKPLRDYALEATRDGAALEPPSAIESPRVPDGSALVCVPLIRLSGPRVRANLTLDEGVAEVIGNESRRRGMTRAAFVEWMARRIARTGG